MGVVYVDVLFLINMTFDLLALWLTACLSESPVKPMRCLLASVIGGVSGVWGLAVCRLPWLLIPLVVISFFLTSFIAFAPRSVKSAVRLSFLFAVFLFLIGGIGAFILRFFISRLGVSETASSGAKVILFALLSLSSSVILTLSSRSVKSRQGTREVSVAVTLGEKTCQTLCMVDTANLVRDPIGGECVVFFPPEKAGELFDERDAAVLQKGKIDGITALTPPLFAHLRLVPAETATGEGLLICVRPDKLCVGEEEKKALFSILPKSPKGGLGICPYSLLP